MTSPGKSTPRITAAELHVRYPGGKTVTTQLVIIDADAVDPWDLPDLEPGRWAAYSVEVHLEDGTRSIVTAGTLLGDDTVTRTVVDFGRELTP